MSNKILTYNSQILSPLRSLLALSATYSCMNQQLYLYRGKLSGLCGYIHNPSNKLETVFIDLSFDFDLRGLILNYSVDLILVLLKGQINIKATIKVYFLCTIMTYCIHYREKRWRGGKKVR